MQTLGGAEVHALSNEQALDTLATSPYTVTHPASAEDALPTTESDATPDQPLRWFSGDQTECFRSFERTAMEYSHLTLALSARVLEYALIMYIERAHLRGRQASKRAEDS